MKKTIITSGLFSLNWRDLLQAFLVAALTPVVFMIYDTVKTGSFSFDWTAILAEAAGGGLLWIIKSFLTPQQIISKPEFEKHDAGPHN